jgi:D-sedoheptulose 7-phosphate isomerase
MGLDYINAFLSESQVIIERVDRSDIAAVADVIAATKARGGRLFFAGSGGGAGHASHATADFRKIGGIEAYCVTDNVSELTARVNDDSWETAYGEWLRGSRIGPQDCLFVFSVGGGDAQRAISANLVNAVDVAIEAGAAVVGVVGRDGGHLRQRATASILIPTVDQAHVTTQVEGFQALMWHLLIGHPTMSAATPKWESVTA